ncbi:hypothetical protein LX32DRAFT_5006 [Colletotrichum zoysiae]|uniref:Uncharacterized protein n=1 Tax=Colletotrichum zoysiae TaxID=1216348 RepID=A0AAD9HRQ3_9PEZI|nr:hypothetical protein LX32DRAFT_5006 [Colletotrichum zoysiae]
MPDTPTPLSRHSLASGGLLNSIALPPGNTSFADCSCPEEAAGPQPCSTAPATAGAPKRDAYRNVTNIPCQDPGSRYRPGRIVRIREQPALPDRSSALAQAGSADEMITGPIISGPSGGAEGTAWDVLAREVVFSTMDRQYLDLSTPMGPAEMQLRNLLREKPPADQNHQAHHAGFSPDSAGRLSEGECLVPRVIKKSPKSRDNTLRPQAAQKARGKVPLEKGADLKTQMDYFLHFNAPTVSTSHPPPSSIPCRGER